MKKLLFSIQIVYIFLFISGSLFAVGERTMSLGGEATWKTAKNRKGVTEVRSVRPHPVLVLSSAQNESVSGYSAATGVLGNFSALSSSALDLSVSFDEKETVFFKDSNGHYRVSVSKQIERVDRVFARAGTGAALFGSVESSRSGDSAPLIIEPDNRNALFSAGNRIRDFTVEFWLYPLNMENGEQILTWVAARPLNGDYAVQRIHCVSAKNRLSWSFVNFFASTDGSSHLNIEFAGDTPVIPKQWSHHLVRFDAATGMLEYIVNGNIEAIVYATAAGRESSEVYTPIAGNGGIFLLGENFMGILDEFKIHNVCAGRSSIQKYVSSGGRMETSAIDLGEVSSGVVRVDVSGGRTGVRGASVFNEFRENGAFRFSDNSELNFFIRSCENPYLIDKNPWKRFIPGQEITGIQGRYVQIAADFYPSSDGEASPYLDELRIVYRLGEAPLPPRNFTAVAVDGGVLLRWRSSISANAAGSLVYYSSVRGELFGTDADLGPSPIDAGTANSLFIDGLKNGTLYYFRVASYDKITETAEYNIGEFSQEVTARPLAGLPFIETSP